MRRSVLTLSFATLCLSLVVSTAIGRSDEPIGKGEKITGPGATEPTTSPARNAAQPCWSSIAESLSASAELVALADAVVLGTPMEVKSHWAPGRTMIYTTYRIRVEGVVDGDADSLLDLTAEGGTVGDTSLRVSNFPNLTFGERYLILVGDLPGYRCVLGGSRGAFLLPPAGSEGGFSVPKIAAMIQDVRKATAR